MIYKQFHNLKLSALGLGCMRLPQLKENEQIDIPALKEMVAYAIKNGVNYFDTAWGYHGGNSEPVMGQVLSAYPRESYHLATKFPGYIAENLENKEDIFQQQLNRCRVEYFDFYLCHTVSESNIDQYLDPKYGFVEFLLEQKKLGRIQHLGFSTHGSLETTERFLDAWGGQMEFCQVQLNWLDWDLQDAKAKVQMLNDRNIPIWVMEPLRGGSLCQLSSTQEERLKQLRPDHRIPQWSFRFLQGTPGVTMILSGMSNFQQVQENIETLSENKPLNSEETQALFAIAREITAKNTLACTNCRYCVEFCPKELNIPGLIKLYNKHVYDGSTIEADELGEEKHPGSCVVCGACTKVCPQQIKIPQMMADLAKQLP